eukprot:TRINITY_DN5858_c3_g1_i1.p1 TRINITY_DN5858_c3_g1~~TRINITY_DN5858_c3_g1_i1.p1  ORF type:complete len:396 (+),score=173.83 TRINITY_DN5858_c3_g1_i1:50-1189(+)
MSLAEQLNNAKLKKVTNAIVKTNNNIVICKDSNDYDKLMHESYIEEYFESLKNFSFRSIFINLNQIELENIIAFHKRFLEIGNSSFIEQLYNNGNNEGFVFNELCNKIENAKQQLGIDQFFVRLSSRSPKDAALTKLNFTQLIEQEFNLIQRREQLLLNLSSSSSIEAIVAESTVKNKKLHALYRASIAALSVEKAIDSIKLLIESARIQGDLEKAIEDMQLKGTTFNLVVREFHQFDAEMEFRGFVYGRKLTALTQYNEFVYFPSIVLNKLNIQNLIINCFEQQILPLVKLDNCTIDFVLIPIDKRAATSEQLELINLKLYVVELNPFAEFAGSGLFSWITEMDLLMGKRQFEFRVLEKAPTIHSQTLPQSWSNFLSD